MVTVVGLGFTGLTAALGFAEFGHKVYGIERDPERMAIIRAGRLPFREPGLDEALARHLGKNFIPADDLAAAAADSELIVYCVGTPCGENGEADLTDLFEALEQTLPAIRDDRFRVLVIKSSVPPSTFRDRILPYLKSRGVRVPERTGAANNPEFLREGHCWEDFIHAGRIVIGVTDPASEALLRKYYAPSGIPVHAVSPTTAEFIKYLSNSVLACLISFANEMSAAAEGFGDIDTAEAFRVLHQDKRWQDGSIRSYFYPGCGYGGFCLPKDTKAFCAAADAAGTGARILREVIALNDRMPEISAERVIRAAGPDKNTRVGILGLSFKPGSDDVRDTPSAKIIRELNRRGYTRVIGYDPAAVPAFRRHYPDLEMEFAGSYAEILSKADIFVIATAWEEFADIRERTDKPVADLRYMADR